MTDKITVESTHFYPNEESRLERLEKQAIRLKRELALLHDNIDAEKSLSNKKILSVPVAMLEWEIRRPYHEIGSTELTWVSPGAYRVPVALMSDDHLIEIVSAEKHYGTKTYAAIVAEVLRRGL